MKGLKWAEVARAADLEGGVWATWGEACSPGDSRWASGRWSWGRIAARLAVAAHTPDKGARLSPWVSGWVWGSGAGSMLERVNASALALGALVLDVDGGSLVNGETGVGNKWTSAGAREVLRSALGLNVRAVVWPSRSWGVKAGPRYKAFIPLACPLRADVAAEWCALLARDFARLGVELDAACMGLGQNQDLPSLPTHPEAPSLEVWPAEPNAPPSAWEGLEDSSWPGVFLDPWDLSRFGGLSNAERALHHLEASKGPPPSWEDILWAQDLARDEEAARPRVEAIGRLLGFDPLTARRASSWPFLGGEPQPQPPRPKVLGEDPPPPAPPKTKQDARPPRTQDETRAHQAERRARARLVAWAQATIDATVDKIRAAHWEGSRKVSGYTGGLWLARLALTDVGPLGPALDAAEVDSVLDGEIRSLGLQRDESREVLAAIRRKSKRHGAVEDLPDTLREILRDFYAEGGR